MKIKRYQATIEKTILTALIVHSRVLGRVIRDVGRDPRGLFQSKWSNLIARWCFDYYLKHRKAPRGIIQDLFIRYAEGEAEEETVQLMERFLETLSGEYARLAEELNEQWVLEQAADYFEKIRMKRALEGAEIALERNDIEKAREFYAEFKRPSFSRKAWIYSWIDSDIDRDTEERDTLQSLVEFKGALGRFLSPHLVREGFISFAGPEKVGKSFWLQEIAWQALNQKRKVLYYVLGDMPRKEVHWRLWSRATRKPIVKQLIRIPTALKITKDGDNPPRGDCTYIEQDSPAWTAREVKKVRDRLRFHTAREIMPWRLRCDGSSVVSASHIVEDIQALSEEGFMPDVVVIDYADLLLSEPGANKLDFRHQIDATWKALRNIALKYHILIVTATQTAARAYTHWLIQKGDFSEDKRKNAHVTGMIGINQTSAEKQKGIYRLNWIFLRAGQWSETQYVWTAGNLAISCPCLVSRL